MSVKRKRCKCVIVWFDDDYMEEYERKDIDREVLVSCYFILMVKKEKIR